MSKRANPAKEIVQLRIRYLLLLALLAGEAHGYEIMKRVKSFEIGDLSVSPGSVYPLLKKLEAEGLVVSEEKIQRGRKVKVYRLTQKGYRELMDTVLGVVDTLVKAFRIHADLLLELKTTGKIQDLYTFARKELEELREKLRELEEVIEKALQVFHQY